MASTVAMEQPHQSGSRRREEGADTFNLREWAFKARMITRENTNSRRFSASNIKSFREDARSFRSNITISSTASSPGYSLKDEIDPSTYSFTTALKALQARTIYNSWECLSPDGLALNSKWNEAEKYICNPLSGEVPMECLSAKTLSGRSFRNLTNRMTMSAPLVYHSGHSRQFQTRPQATLHDVADHDEELPVTENKMEGMTRDVGTQSTPPEVSSCSPSPASTPPIIERSPKRCEEEASDSPNYDAKLKAEDLEVGMEEKEKETERKGDERSNYKEEGESGRMQSGCLSWMKKRQREKHKPRKKKTGEDQKHDQMKSFKTS